MAKRPFLASDILQETILRANRIARMAEVAIQQGLRSPKDDPNREVIVLALCEKAMDLNAVALHVTHLGLSLLGEVEPPDYGEGDEDPPESN